MARPSKNSWITIPWTLLLRSKDWELNVGPQLRRRRENVHVTPSTTVSDTRCFCDRKWEERGAGILRVSISCSHWYVSDHFSHFTAESFGVGYGMGLEVGWNWGIGVGGSDFWKNVLEEPELWQKSHFSVEFLIFFCKFRPFWWILWVISLQHIPNP